MINTRLHFCRVLRRFGAVLAICAALSLLGSSGTGPFLCAVLAQISGEHRVISGMGEDHVRVVLAHESSIETHQHGLISTILVFFADAPARTYDDHVLCFQKLRNSWGDSSRVSVEQPSETQLTVLPIFEIWREPTPLLNVELWNPLHSVCELAVQVVRCTILLI